MTSTTESGSSPYASWINVARLAWMVLSIAAMVLFFIGFSNKQNATLPSCTTPNADCPFYTVSQEDAQVAQQMGLAVSLALATGLIPFLLARLGSVLVAVLIFWRKSDDWVALMFSLSLTMGILEEVVDSTGAFQPIAALLLGVSGGLFVLVPFVFPNGRFEPRWTRPIALLLAVLSVITFIASQQVLNVGMSAVSVLAIYAIIFRYRRVSNAVERQQTKWAATGLLVIFVTLLFSIGVGSIFPASQPTSGRVVFLLINGFLYPGSGVAMLVFFAIAILRYRLWDIDILIRRTLQYTLLTGLLALVYFGGVVTLQGILGPLTGSAESPLVTVITTLGIAALFTPLRRRVQAFIDRRFYRKKYNAEQALAQFAVTARDEVDMDKLTAALIGVVEETMLPERVTLWLKPATRKVIDDARSKL